MRIAYSLVLLFAIGCVSESDEPPSSGVDDTEDSKADGNTSGIPLLAFDYTSGHDHFDCASPIPAKWHAAIDASVPHFQALWNARGEPLLRTTAQLLGTRFFTTTDRAGRRSAVRNLQGTFTACPGSPGMGVPLILQASFYVDLAGTGAVLTSKSDEWLTYTFHEVLHRFVDDKAAALTYAGLPQLVQPTPALAYWSQWLSDNAATLPPTVIKPVVLQHLHLLAIMKAVFTKIGRPDLIAHMRTFDTTYDTTGSMGTAWSIVDLPGATEALVGEIKQRSR